MAFNAGQWREVISIAMGDRARSFRDLGFKRLRAFRKGVPIDGWVAALEAAGPVLPEHACDLLLELVEEYEKPFHEERYQLFCAKYPAYKAEIRS